MWDLLNRIRTFPLGHLHKEGFQVVTFDRYLAVVQWWQSLLWISLGFVRDIVPLGHMTRHCAVTIQPIFQEEMCLGHDLILFLRSGTEQIEYRNRSNLLFFCIQPDG